MQVCPIQRENISTETVPVKDLMAHTVDKEIKTTVLNVPKEQKEYVGKVKKTLCQQNGNLNKEKA